MWVGMWFISTILDSKHREMEKDNLLTILALGYHIHPPPIGQIREMKSVSHIPFRTFRGQFASYCSKRGKWYSTCKSHYAVYLITILQVFQSETNKGSYDASWMGYSWLLS